MSRPTHIVVGVHPGTSTAVRVLRVSVLGRDDDEPSEYSILKYHAIETVNSWSCGHYAVPRKLADTLFETRKLGEKDGVPVVVRYAKLPRAESQPLEVTGMVRMGCAVFRLPDPGPAPVGVARRVFAAQTLTALGLPSRWVTAEELSAARVAAYGVLEIVDPEWLKHATAVVGVET